MDIASYSPPCIVAIRQSAVQKRQPATAAYSDAKKRLVSVRKQMQSVTVMGRTKRISISPNAARALQTDSAMNSVSITASTRPKA